LKHGRRECSLKKGHEKNLLQVQNNIAATSGQLGKLEMMTDRHKAVIDKAKESSRNVQPFLMIVRKLSVWPTTMKMVGVW